MRIRSSLAVAVAVLAVSACAPQSPSDTAAEPAASPMGYPGTSARWTGNLTPTNSFSGGIQGATRQNTYGTVMLAVSPQSQNATRAIITFNAPIQSSTVFRWALLPGRCGSGSIPLLAPELFPDLEMGSNGRGTLDTSVPLTMPTSGQLHLNIYTRGAQLSDVIGCANLRFESR